MDRLRFVKETVWGTVPEGPLRPIAFNSPPGQPSTGMAKLDGGATIECECGGTIDTARALIREQIPGGLRFCGTPCDSCHRSYTIEVGTGESNG